MSLEYLKSFSKFLLLVLCYKFEVIGIKLDENGWVDVDELIEGFIDKGKEFDFFILEVLVVSDDKQCYIFNEDKSKICVN